MADFINGFVEGFTNNFIREQRYLMIWRGLQVTVIISVLSILLGLVLGILANVFRATKIAPLRWLAAAYIDVVRGTPFVTQLLIIRFVVFNGSRLPDVLIGSVACGLNSGAYVAEIIRAGIQSIDHGQTEAGRSLGFSAVQTMRYIIAPQAVKNILPALANELIVLIKETAVVGYIAIADLTKAGEYIRSRTYDPFYSLFGVMIIYYLIIKLLTIGISKLEKYLHRAD